MLILLLLVGSLSQNTYYITVDDALSDLLKKQPKGYKPWHPSLSVRLRVQEEERTQEFYSFVQQQIKIKQRGMNTQHPMQFVQVQGPEFFENLVCKCSFSPAEVAQEEEEGGEGGDEADAGGACEPEGGGEGEGEDGGGEEVEFIVKKTKAHGKDFSFLQVGTQSNLNQYIPQPQQVDQLSQYDQRLLAQEQLIKQFMEKQNQLTQQLSMLQQSQGVFVPSLFPTVVDPNFLTPQQQAQMLYLLQLQQQQQQIQQQLLQQQMLNQLSFQSNPTMLKNENAQMQQQFQIPIQQPFVYAQPVTQNILNPQQLLLQQQLLQQQQISQQQIPQQINQQQLLQQQQQLLNQQQISQPQQIGQPNIPQQIPQFQQSQVPPIIIPGQQQQFSGFQQQPVQQQIPQQVQYQNLQSQSTYQQIPQQQIQQQQMPQEQQMPLQQQIPQQQQIPLQQQQIPQQQIPQQQQNGFLQQPQQQQNIPQFDQLLAQQMAQPLMQPQFLQKQPQIIGGG